jgi:hypothetical protein
MAHGSQPELHLADLKLTELHVPDLDQRIERGSAR